MSDYIECGWCGARDGQTHLPGCGVLDWPKPDPVVQPKRDGRKKSKSGGGADARGK